MIQHFELGIREKHVRDLVCPCCGEPNLADTEQAENYFPLLELMVVKVFVRWYMTIKM